MKNRFYLAKYLLGFSAAMAFVSINGCESKPTATSETEAAHDDHDHEDHDGHESHSHAHEHGPHGGEMVVLEPGDDKIEWVTDSGTGNLTIYVDALTAAGKEIASVTMQTKLADKENSYELSKKEDGSYQLDDTALVTVIDASSVEDDTVSAIVVVKVGEEEHKGKLVNMHH